ncbi:MAG: hypothetical protein PUH70_00045 [Clostridiales bacterium]|nr:hypothetical protein [Clostridiales bacterium]MDY5513298.1 hypothetical protein [Candidatus Ventricola sp.]
MYRILMIESAARGVLFVNGQFCGPLEEGGQAFPASPEAEIYVQLFPFSGKAAPLTVAMRLRGGEIERLEPQEHAYALLWPDGILELELRPGWPGEAPAPQETQTAASGTLLRYLTMRLAGDAEAEVLLLRPQDTPELPPYDAVVPLRFAPMRAGERFDERAGLVRRLAPNIARVDAALAVTVPAGQGRRRIETIEVQPFSAPATMR